MANSSPTWIPCNDFSDDDDGDQASTPIMDMDADDLAKMLLAPPPPPPPMARQGVGPIPTARSDRVYELERITLKTTQPRHYAVTSRTNGQSMRVGQVEQVVEQEDLAVRSNLPIKRIYDRHSRANRMKEYMQRSSGTLTQVPIFHRGPKAGHAYPEKWDYDCWWDRHTFTTRPVGVPTRVIYQDSRRSYKATGMFCSFNCARAYASDRKMYKSGPLFCSFIRDLHKARGEIVHFKNQSLEPAPHFACLKSIGGYQSIEEFRSQHCQQTRIHCIPQTLTVIPLGFNVYEFPRDPHKMFTSRPKKYQNTLSQYQGAVQKRKRTQKQQPSHTSNKKRRKGQQQVKIEEKTCQSTPGVDANGFIKKKKSFPDRDWKLRHKLKAMKEQWKMSRKKPQKKRTIRDMMGIKTKKSKKLKK